MSKIRKLFGEYDMTWKKVIVFAIISAIYTALINEVLFLRDTSFQDIAISYECWILFAVFIIVNCKNYKDAALKCFVFFLISQPLIYLIEVPFEPEGFGIFRFYKFWFVITLLTIPGAAVAYQIKRNDWISVLVLTIANGLLVFIASKYLNSCIGKFPNHLLSLIFCIALAVFMIFVFIKEPKKKIASLLLVPVMFAACCFINDVSFKPRTQEVEIGIGDYLINNENSEIVDAVMEDGKIIFTAKGQGTACVEIKDGNTVIKTFYVTVNGNSIYVEEFKE